MLYKEVFFLVKQQIKNSQHDVCRCDFEEFFYITEHYDEPQTCYTSENTQEMVNLVLQLKEKKYGS